ANSLGIAYFNLNRMDEAIKAFREAYRLEPSPFIARNLAESYEKTGKMGEAHRWYKLALESFDRRLSVGGQRAEMLNSRAFCAAKLGHYDEALANVQEARKLKPSQNAFLFRTAQIYAMAGRRGRLLARGFPPLPRLSWLPGRPPVPNDPGIRGTVTCRGLAGDLGKRRLRSLIRAGPDLADRSA